MTRAFPTYLLISSVVMLTASLRLGAQNNIVLTEAAFIQQVKQYHPVAKQAELITKKAAADLLAARGAFDPVVEATTTAKTLDGKNYYRYTNSQLKIPTATGVSVKAGYEKSDGLYINPERTKGVASYLGIEVPLLNGLLTDKKRTALRQASIFRELSEQERLAKMNDLLFDARTAYWEWAGAWRLYRVFDNSRQVAERRARLMSIAFRNGDRALADTVEAWAQLQNVAMLVSGAQLELSKKAIGLSSFLWNADENPYLLPDAYTPDTVALASVLPLGDTAALMEKLSGDHPAIRSGRLKSQALEVDRRYKWQNFLPVVNLQANLLSKDYYRYKNLSWPYLENNYKLGVQVSVPLLWRQERGDYQNALIKLRDNTLELDRKQWDLQNKVRAYYVEALQIQQQLGAAAEMNRSYNFLLKTEELKFSQGESSLFLVNARENKTLETQQKLIELQVKYQKAANAVQWSAGLMGM